MHRFSFFALMTAAALALTACEGENLFRTGEADLTGPDPSLVYEAIRLEFDTNTLTEVDLVDEGGSFRLALDESALLFESRFRFGTVDFATTGSFESDEGILTFSDDPFLDDTIVTRRSYTFEDHGDLLLLEGVDVVLDVDDDGFDEVGTMDVWMEGTD